MGRVALASLFVLGGINKLINYGATLDAMSRVGLPAVEWLLPMVIFLELIGGAVVAAGTRYSTIAALALAAFAIATNFVFHDFWNMPEERAATELSLFFKNLSIAGGLMFLAGTQAR